MSVTPLEIIVKGDVSQGVTSLQKVQAELGKTAISAQKTDSSLAKMGGGMASVGNLAKTATSQIGGLVSGLATGGLLTAVTLAGAAIFALGEKLIGLSEAQKLSNDALSSGRDEYVKATLLVDKLKDRVQLAKDGIIAKDVVLKEYNNSIGKTTGAVKSLDEAERELVTNGPKYIQYTLLKAAANYAAQKSAEKLFDAELRSAKNAEINSRIKQDDIGEFIKSGEENLRKQRRLDDQKQVDLLKSISENFRTQAEEVSKGFKKIEASTVEGVKKVANARKKAVEDAEKFINPRLMQIQGLEESFNIDKKPISRTSGATIEPTINVRPKFDFQLDNEAFFKKLEAFFDRERIIAMAEEFSALVSATVEDIAESSLTSLGDAIGNALSGGEDVIPNLFGSLMQNVGSQVQELGKFLIKAAITIKVAKEAFQKLLANPIAAAVVGIGLVALGALLKSQASKQFKGFATGGTVGESGFYNVGERGQERVFLPQGARVQPNNEVMAYGGGRQAEELIARMSATELVILLRRGEAIMGRNN